jgi:hypothetical protein
MEKQFILPLITLIIIFIALLLFILPATNEFITAFVVAPQEKYSLKGEVRITTLTEISDKCNINIEIENENTQDKKVNYLTYKEFEEKSEIIKQEEFFVYTTELKELTQGMYLEKGDYFITISVFCNKTLISQTQEYFSV